MKEKGGKCKLKEAKMKPLQASALRGGGGVDYGGSSLKMEGKGGVK